MRFQIACVNYLRFHGDFMAIYRREIAAVSNLLKFRCDFAAILRQKLFCPTPQGCFVVTVVNNDHGEWSSLWQNQRQWKDSNWRCYEQLHFEGQYNTCQDQTNTWYSWRFNTDWPGLNISWVSKWWWGKCWVCHSDTKSCKVSCKKIRKKWKTQSWKSPLKC